MNVNDPGFSDWVNTILNEESELSGNDDTVNDPNFLSDHSSNSEICGSDNTENDANFESHHSSDSEICGSDEEFFVPIKKARAYDKSGDFDHPSSGQSKSSSNYYGRNRYKWSNVPSISRTRTRAHNIISHLPGNIGLARQFGKSCSQSDAWSLIFTEDILTEIVLRSNEKLIKIRQKISDADRMDYRDLDLTELKAFLGLLFLTAIFKSNDEDLKSLFSTDGTGREIFRCCMPLKRMYVLLICLRFDNEENRNVRKETDPSAAISWVFHKFVENCQKNYSIGEYACIDEMLVGFRGRCRFRMYIPSKPRKYGIKLVVLCDAKTHYFWNGYIYTGKGSDGNTLSEIEKKFAKPTQAVLNLVKPLEGTNRNITADNWFTSVELLSELKKRGLTYVGTIKKNKKEIPSSFLPAKKRETNSCLFGFSNDVTLVSFVPKRNKAVILVSSMHHDKSIDSESGKPEIIEFYNITKGGVDALDEKCTKYSTSRRTRRWPMAIFFNLLNISLVNSYVIFSSFPDNPKQSRFDFIKSLAQELIASQLQRRLMNTRLPRAMKSMIHNILKIKPETGKKRVLSKQTRCAKCPRQNDRKTKSICAVCELPVCASCSAPICDECRNERNEDL